jgi:hypothetical protein
MLMDALLDQSLKPGMRGKQVVRQRFVTTARLARRNPASLASGGGPG